VRDKFGPAGGAQSIEETSKPRLESPIFRLVRKDKEP